jgi:hypothetical protein
VGLGAAGRVRRRFSGSVVDRAAAHWRAHLNDSAVPVGRFGERSG